MVNGINMLKQVKIDKNVASTKIWYNRQKNIYNGKNKIIAARINCSKQIVWREPDHTVCLVLVSVLW